MPRLIILDACVALLVVVGLTSRRYIEKHKRLKDCYDAVDFDLVTGILEQYDGVIFTPNALSETSGLVRYLADPIRSEVSEKLRIMIGSTEERFVKSRVAAGRDEYLRLGLTDSALLEVAVSGASLLTVDARLYDAALRAGLSAINYNHIKDQREDFR